MVLAAASWTGLQARRFASKREERARSRLSAGFLLGYILLGVDLLKTSRIERGVLDVPLLCQQRASILQPIDALGPVELDVHSRDDSVACC